MSISLFQKLLTVSRLPICIFVFAPQLLGQSMDEPRTNQISAIQSSSSESPPPPQGGTSFPVKVSSNLVVMRVVVRDADGKPVENLKKEDFRITDRGKQQIISQFDVVDERPPSGTPLARNPNQLVQPVLPNTPANVGNFFVLYFDDLDSTDSDINHAAAAADHYLNLNLEPNDRIAIFTSSEMLSGFTSDREQIHNVLAKIRVSSRSLSLVHHCPDLSDYQALQITENNAEAFSIAFDEAAHCDNGVLMAPGQKQAVDSNSMQSGLPQPGSLQSGRNGIADAVIRGLAENVVNQMRSQAATNLQQIDQVVNYCSQMPGQRTIILLSPGFLSQSEQFRIDRLIDHALREQVVISTLDPRGLATLRRESETERSYIPIKPKMLEGARRMDSQRELAASAILADIAEGTGGEYLRNSNDLTAGLVALAGPRIYYILAFAPKEIHKDGQFHELKVSLARRVRGVRIRTRRGYFAPKEGETFSAAEVAPKPPLVNPDANGQQEVRDAVLSRTELNQLPATLEVKPPIRQGETRQVEVSGHLRTALLPLRNEGDKNLNTVTFVFAVFNEGDELLNAQQREAKISVPDGQLQEFLKVGVTVNVTFRLKPGNYRLREVVTDSIDHRMTTLSRNLEISSEDAASLPLEERPSSPSRQPPLAVSNSPQPPTAVPNAIKSEELKLYSDARPYMDEPMSKLKRSVRQLGGLDPEANQEQLHVLLAKVGSRSDELLSKVPNLTSDETVSETQRKDASAMSGCVGESCGDFARPSTAETGQKFSYMILTQTRENGGQMISEYRSGRNGKPLTQGTPLPYFRGFITTWLFFSSRNQAESRFRYLGEQKTDGHDTFVIGFAQLPGAVQQPGRYMTEKGSIPMLFQGIAWIDRADFRIVRMRTDLLAPQPDSQLLEQTSNIVFGPVHIASHDSDLWLPQTVDAEMEANGQLLHERHEYSKYRLYQVNTKIIAQPQ